VSTTTRPLHALIRWPAEAIWQAVVPQLPGFSVEVLPQVDSTNSELMRRCRAASLAALSNAALGLPEAPEAILLVAEHQNAGRGRLGRQWQSQAGASLTFSLGLPLQPVNWSGLSLAVGVSLAESLEPANGKPPTLQLKWPNDLWLGQRKLGGILVETANWGDQRYVVIGVGLNVTPPDEDFSAAAPSTSWASGDAQTPSPMAATSLQALWPGVDAAWALQAVAAPLVQAVLAFEREGFAPFRARFAARDALAGRNVKLSDGTEGTACGVGVQGALLLQTQNGLQNISSLEVSVRPADPLQPTRR
jgi:BirA family biotin operon repressor/biotin-[acetyl-CoA-carboxylase] ligase